MGQVKLHPNIAVVIFSLITGYLLTQHFAWGGFGRANIVVIPMGILSAVFAWYTFSMQHIPTWKRGIMTGVLASLVGTVLITSFFLLSRSGGIPDSSFVSELFTSTFFSLFFNGLKFTLPIIISAAVAGFLSDNYIQFQEVSK